MKLRKEKPKGKIRWKLNFLNEKKKNVIKGKRARHQKCDDSVMKVFLDTSDDWKMEK